MARKSKKGVEKVVEVCALCQESGGTRPLSYVIETLHYRPETRKRVCRTEAVLCHFCRTVMKELKSSSGRMPVSLKDVLAKPGKITPASLNLRAAEQMAALAR